MRIDIKKRKRETLRRGKLSISQAKPRLGDLIDTNINLYMVQVEAVKSPKHECPRDIWYRDNIRIFRIPENNDGQKKFHSKNSKETFQINWRKQHE